MTGEVKGTQMGAKASLVASMTYIRGREGNIGILGSCHDLEEMRWQV
jgi:hypothetical protein